MELKLIPSDKNAFPLKGLLIKSASVVQWINEIQLLKLSLSDIQLYPVPDVVANTIWGCFIISHEKLSTSNIGRHELCQRVTENLYIPERSIVFPMPSATELEKLFSSGIYIVHPDFGWVELNEEVNIQDIVAIPPPKTDAVTKPVRSAFIPRTIRSFQVHSLPAEEVLKNLEEQAFPKHKELEDKPLNLWEKMRLGFYKSIFANTQDAQQGGTSNSSSNFASKLESVFQKIFKGNDQWNRVQQDFHDLEERNKKNVERLMDLLKKDPDLALQYAIPLGESGLTRGGTSGHFDFGRRWSDFSLFGNMGARNSSGSVDLGDHYYDLQRQYLATADDLIKRKEYQKAAFVYMKLLKDYNKAAATLEEGKHYQEAATIYLKHAGNKHKAAECFEKGNMTYDAIALYKELNENEKVGDLYMTVANQQQAHLYYEKVASSYKSRGQCIKASIIYRSKMKNPSAAQAVLLDGWRIKQDAVNCLQNYFNNIPDTDELEKEINALYQNEVASHNRELFLHALKHEYKKKHKLQDMIQEMAYEIIAMQIPLNRSIVSELKEFNPGNQELLKDTLRFKVNRKLKD
jgi:hypothetical protein